MSGKEDAPDKMEEFDGSDFAGLNFESGFDSILEQGPSSSTVGSGSVGVSQQQTSSQNSFGQCSRCDKYRSDLERLDNEHRVNFQFLKKKIISTDLLIRRCKAKTDESEAQCRTIEDLNSRLEQADRETAILSEQLKTSVASMKPLKDENERLQAMLKTKTSEVSELQIKLAAEEAFKSQTQALDSEIRKWENDRTEHNKKIQFLEKRKQELLAKTERLTREKTVVSSEKNILAKRMVVFGKALQQAQDIVSAQWRKLQLNGLTDGDLKPYVLPEKYESFITKISSGQSKETKDDKDNLEQMSGQIELELGDLTTQVAEMSDDEEDSEEMDGGKEKGKKDKRKQKKNTDDKKNKEKKEESDSDSNLSDVSILSHMDDDDWGGQKTGGIGGRRESDRKSFGFESTSGVGCVSKDRMSDRKEKDEKTDEGSGGKVENTKKNSNSLNVQSPTLKAKKIFGKKLKSADTFSSERNHDLDEKLCRGRSGTDRGVVARNRNEERWRGRDKDIENDDDDNCGGGGSVTTKENKKGSVDDKADDLSSLSSLSSDSDDIDDDEDNSVEKERRKKDDSDKQGVTLFPKLRKVPQKLKSITKEAQRMGGVNNDNDVEMSMPVLTQPSPVKNVNTDRNVVRLEGSRVLSSTGGKTSSLDFNRPSAVSMTYSKSVAIKMKMMKEDDKDEEEKEVDVVGFSSLSESSFEEDIEAKRKKKEEEEEEDKRLMGAGKMSFQQVEKDLLEKKKKAINRREDGGNVTGAAMVSGIIGAQFCDDDDDDDFDDDDNDDDKDMPVITIPFMTSKEEGAGEGGGWRMRNEERRGDKEVGGGAVTKAQLQALLLSSSMCQVLSPLPPSPCCSLMSDDEECVDIGGVDDGGEIVEVSSEQSSSAIIEVSSEQSSSAIIEVSSEQLSSAIIEVSSEQSSSAMIEVCEQSSTEQTSEPTSKVLRKSRLERLSDEGSSEQSSSAMIEVCEQFSTEQTSEPTSKVLRKSRLERLSDEGSSEQSSSAMIEVCEQSSTEQTCETASKVLRKSRLERLSDEGSSEQSSSAMIEVCEQSSTEQTSETASKVLRKSRLERLSDEGSSEQSSSAIIEVCEQSSTEQTSETASKVLRKSRLERLSDEGSSEQSSSAMIEVCEQSSTEQTSEPTSKVLRKSRLERLSDEGSSEQSSSAMIEVCEQSSTEQTSETASKVLRKSRLERLSDEGSSEQSSSAMIEVCEQSSTEQTSETASKVLRKSRLERLSDEGSSEQSSSAIIEVCEQSSTEQTSETASKVLRKSRLERLSDEGSSEQSSSAIIEVCEQSSTEQTCETASKVLRKSRLERLSDEGSSEQSSSAMIEVCEQSSTEQTSEAASIGLLTASSSEGRSVEGSGATSSAMSEQMSTEQSSSEGTSSSTMSEAASKGSITGSSSEGSNNTASTLCQQSLGESHCTKLSEQNFEGSITSLTEGSHQQPHKRSQEELSERTDHVLFESGSSLTDSFPPQSVKAFPTPAGTHLDLMLTSDHKSCADVPTNATNKHPIKKINSSGDVHIGTRLDGVGKMGKTNRVDNNDKLTTRKHATRTAERCVTSTKVPVEDNKDDDLSSLSSLSSDSDCEDESIKFKCDDKDLSQGRDDNSNSTDTDDICKGDKDGDDDGIFNKTDNKEDDPALLGKVSLTTPPLKRVSFTVSKKRTSDMSKRTVSKSSAIKTIKRTKEISKEFIESSEDESEDNDKNKNDFITTIKKSKLGQEEEQAGQSAQEAYIIKDKNKHKINDTIPILSSPKRLTRSSSKGDNSSYPRVSDSSIKPADTPPSPTPLSVSASRLRDSDGDSFGDVMDTNKQESADFGSEKMTTNLSRKTQMECAAQQLAKMIAKAKSDGTSKRGKVGGGSVVRGSDDSRVVGKEIPRMASGRRADGCGVGVSTNVQQQRHVARKASSKNNTNNVRLLLLSQDGERSDGDSALLDGMRVREAKEADSFISGSGDNGVKGAGDVSSLEAVESGGRVDDKDDDGVDDGKMFSCVDDNRSEFSEKGRKKTLQNDSDISSGSVVVGGGGDAQVESDSGRGERSLKRVRTRSQSLRSSSELARNVQKQKQTPSVMQDPEVLLTNKDLELIGEEGIRRSRSFSMMGRLTRSQSLSLSSSDNVKEDSDCTEKERNLISSGDKQETAGKDIKPDMCNDGRGHGFEREKNEGETQRGRRIRTRSQSIKCSSILERAGGDCVDDKLDDEYNTEIVFPPAKIFKMEEPLNDSNTKSGFCVMDIDAGRGGNGDEARGKVCSLVAPSDAKQTEHKNTHSEGKTGSVDISNVDVNNISDTVTRSVMACQNKQQTSQLVTSVNSAFSQINHSYLSNQNEVLSSPSHFSSISKLTSMSSLSSSCFHPLPTTTQHSSSIQTPSNLVKKDDTNIIDSILPHLHKANKTNREITTEIKTRSQGKALPPPTPQDLIPTSIEDKQQTLTTNSLAGILKSKLLHDSKDTDPAQSDPTQPLNVIIPLDKSSYSPHGSSPSSSVSSISSSSTNTIATKSSNISSTVSLQSSQKASTRYKKPFTEILKDMINFFTVPPLLSPLSSSPSSPIPSWSSLLISSNVNSSTLASSSPSSSSTSTPLNLDEDINDINVSTRQRQKHPSASTRQQRQNNAMSSDSQMMMQANKLLTVKRKASAMGKMGSNQDKATVIKKGKSVASSVVSGGLNKTGGSDEDRCARKGTTVQTISFSGFSSLQEAVDYSLRHFLSVQDLNRIPPSVQSTVDDLSARVHDGNVTEVWICLVQRTLLHMRRCGPQKSTSLEQLLCRPTDRGLSSSGGVSGMELLEHSVMDLMVAFMDRHQGVVDKSVLMGSVWTAIFDKSLVSMGVRLALCRLFCGLCRKFEDLEQARVLVYNIAWCGYLHLSSCLLSMLGVWPDLVPPTSFTDSSPLCRVLHFLMHLELEQDRLLVGQIMNGVEQLTGWQVKGHHPTAPTKLLKGLMDSLVDACSNDKGGIFEYAKSIELLCVAQGPAWSQDHFIHKGLIGVFQRFSMTSTLETNAVAMATHINIAKSLLAVHSFSEATLRVLRGQVLGKVVNTKLDSLPLTISFGEFLMELCPLDPKNCQEYLRSWEETNAGRLSPDVLTKLADTRKCCANLDNSHTKTSVTGEGGTNKDGAKKTHKKKGTKTQKSKRGGKKS